MFNFSVADCIGEKAENSNRTTQTQDAASPPRSKESRHEGVMTPKTRSILYHCLRKRGFMQKRKNQMLPYEERRNQTKERAARGREVGGNAVVEGSGNSG